MKANDFKLLTTLSNLRFSKQQKNCLKCLYCVKAFRSPNDGEEKIQLLRPQDRIKAQSGDFSYLRKTDYFIEYQRCFRGQWDEALDGSDKIAIRNDLIKRKCNKFLFYEKAKGMSLDAAMNEQKQQKNKYKGVKLVFITIFSGIIVTVIASLIIGPVLTFLIQHL